MSRELKDILQRRYSKRYYPNSIKQSTYQKAGTLLSKEKNARTRGIQLFSTLKESSQIVTE